MARCGCAGSCGCAAVAGTGVLIGGTGTSADPWKISATGPKDCTATVDCLNGRVGQGLYYDAAAHRLAVRFSTQSGNTAGAGSDGGIYVPPAGTAGTVAVVPSNSTTIGMMGQGTTNDPLKAWLIGGGRAYVKDSVDMNFSGVGTDTDGVTAVRKALRLRAVSDTKQTLTSAWKKYPFETAGLLVTNGVGRVVSGNIVVDVPGYYLVSLTTRQYCNNAANAAQNTIAYAKLASTSGTGELWWSAAGNGTGSCTPGGTCVMHFPAKGNTLWVEVQVAGGYGAGPHVDYMCCDLAFIGQ